MKYRELRPIGCVNHIVTRGAIDVLFVQCDDNIPALAVEGDNAGAVRSVQTFIIGNRLVVEGDVGNLRFIDSPPGVPGTVTAETSVDERLLFPPRRSAAVVDIELPSISSITVRGFGIATLYYLNQPGLRIGLEGDGRIEAYGRVGDLEIAIEGTGDVDAAELLAAHGVLRIGGTGNIAAAVQSDVCSEISGVGNIVVYGNPLGCRKERVTGLGNVSYV